MNSSVVTVIVVSGLSFFIFILFFCGNNKHMNSSVVTVIVVSGLERFIYLFFYGSARLCVAVNVQHPGT
jgi:hypothetical protein